MSSTAMIWLSVVASVGCVVALFWRCGSRDILPYLTAYFLLFGLGPAVNFARSATTYWQIDVSEIGKASIGVALAIAGVCVVGLLMPPAKGPLSAERLAVGPRKFPLVPVTLFGLAIYAMMVLALRGPEMLAADKIGRIDLAGRWHYIYVLFEMFACSLYFLARQDAVSRFAYWLNIACYVGYCLITMERDFLFGFFAILLCARLFQRRTATPILLAGGACVLIATFLTSIRSGNAVGPSEALNEGSLMIVDTIVMGMIPSSHPYFFGETYANALAALAPSILHEREPALADWLINTIAPGAPGGYGFSMTAEAYMNFGIFFIPVVFAVLTIGQRILIARIAWNNFFTYFNVLFTITWMYNFRGESRAFLMTLIYGAIFYAAIELTSLPARPVVQRTDQRPYPTERTSPLPRLTPTADRR